MKINNEKRMNKEELESLIKELDIPKEEFYVLSSGNLVLEVYLMMQET